HLDRDAGMLLVELPDQRLHRLPVGAAEAGQEVERGRATAAAGENGRCTRQAGQRRPGCYTGRRLGAGLEQVTPGDQSLCDCVLGIAHGGPPTTWIKKERASKEETELHP